MNEDLQQSLRKIPDIIVHYIEMASANDPILLYEGNFKLKNEITEVELNGKLEFKWAPNYGLKFSGNVNNSTFNHFQDLTEISKTYKFLINENECGTCWLTKRTFHFGNNDELKIEGKLKNNQEGHFGENVDKVRFAIPNLRDFYGSTVKYKEGDKIKTKNCRVVLKNKDYQIILDANKNITNLKDEFRDNDGFIITHYGELKRQEGKISFSETKNVLKNLSLFLTFLNGRRTAAIFQRGILDEKILWADNSAYTSDAYKFVLSWPQHQSIDGISQLWENFSLLLNDEDNKDFFTTAIHWYIEANSLSAYTEGSLILAQTSLELIYNFLIVEYKKIITGKDSQNISASNKIRLLLSQLSITPEIPTAFVNLLKLKKTNSEITDGPEAIVQIRNAIVHSQENKRRKLKEIKPLARYEALQLSIWYIEVALLFISDYQGKYFNRTVGANWAGDGEELVPWAKKK